LAFADHLSRKSKANSGSPYPAKGGFGSGMAKAISSASPANVSANAGKKNPKKPSSPSAVHPHRESGKVHSLKKTPQGATSQGILLEAGQTKDIVWRGVLRQVRHHQPAGVAKKDGSVGKGWGIFVLSPVQVSDLPEGFSPDAAIYARKSWTVKGVLIGDPQIGAELLCHGKCVDDPKYGKQFEASVLVEPLPDVRDLDHILRWLTKKTGQSRHRIVGMTEARARKAIDHFGTDVLVAMADPERLREIFPEKLCQAMAESFLKESRSYRLHLFFLDHGLHQGHVHAILSHLEETSARSVGGEAWTVDAVVARTQKDPYWLTDISGIGFLVADRLAMSLGMAEDDPARLRAGLRYALDLREKDGHTATQEEALLALAGGKEILRVDAMANPERAKERLREALSQWLSDTSARDILSWEIPSKDGFRKEKWVARAVCGYSERYVARRILEMTQKSAGNDASGILDARALHAEWSRRESASGSSIVLSASQRAAILRACSARFGVLTGGPGTGKTTCLDTVAHAALSVGLRVELCAPSGKAASRLKQATGLDGKTIHRLLRLGPDKVSGYDEENPYPADLFIVDESSMVDVYLMQHLLRAVPQGAGVLMVGDDQQLPSVGPGRIFGDIIDSGVVPVGRLTENHRQGGASDIAVGAARVISGRLPQSIPRDYSGCRETRVPDESSFFSVQWVERTVHEESENPAFLGVEPVQKMIERDIRDLIARGVPVESIQVLTPKNVGNLGVVALNEPVTALLNALDHESLIWPASSRAPCFLGSWEDQPITWRVGDRVIQVENDYETGVFNGDMGVVVWTEPESDDQKPLVGVYFEHGELPAIRNFLDRTVNSEKPFHEWDLRCMQQFASLLNERSGSHEADPEGYGKIVWYDGQQISRIRPAGVLTIHKTQGSEYPYVIMLLHTQHWFMSSRPLLYTGMTRAKKGLRLYLSEKSARKAVANLGAARDTLLARRLSSRWI
jgi:exodeoxyribonuclease V alpha subunit